MEGSSDAPSGLYLALDLSVKTLRATVVDDELETVWSGEVEFDRDCVEYGTRGGCHVVGDDITSPPEMHVKGVDILLEKLAAYSATLPPEEALMSRIKAIGGAAQQHAPVFLSPVTPTLLTNLAQSQSSASSRLSTILNSSSAFEPLANTPNCQDTSTARQSRELEAILAEMWLEGDPPTPEEQKPDPLAENPIEEENKEKESEQKEEGSNGIVGEGVEPLKSEEDKENEGEKRSSVTEEPKRRKRRDGAEEMARRTGSRCFHRFTGLQIMKLRQQNPDVLKRTYRISLLSSWLASVFLGWIAPLDEADACGMNLWNIQERKWDEKIVAAVMGEEAKLQRDGNAEAMKGRQNGITSEHDDLNSETLIKQLGEPVTDGAKVLGKISKYFVRRFGFDSNCIVTPFSGDNCASILSFNLSARDAMITLGVGDADTVMMPVEKYIPSGAHQVFPHPARTDDSSPAYVAMIAYKDAGLARSFVRDIYCNASWDVFNQLVALIPPGGSIGLDDKLFSYFYPHGEAGVWQGISRFSKGQRVPEYTDRRANPRAILESQFLSMRIRLARISQMAQGKTTKVAKDGGPMDNLVGFDPYDHTLLPERVIVVGGAGENVVLLETLAAVIGCPVFKATSCAGNMSEKAPMTSPVRLRGALTSSSLGAAYRACWTYWRSQGTMASFSEFTSELLRRQIARSAAAAKSATPTTTTATSPVGMTTASLHPSVPVITTTLTSGQELSPDIPQSPPPPGLAPRQTTATAINNTSTTSASSTSVTIPAATSSVGSSLVVPIHTAEEDSEVGLVKVAQPDEDLFRFYGGLIEEFLRLEGYVAKGLL